MDRTIVMRQFEDRLEPNAGPVVYPAGWYRVVYVVEGSLRIDADFDTSTVMADDAILTEGRMRVAAGPEGAKVWRFEIGTPPTLDDGLVVEEGVTSENRIDARTDLPKADGYLIRCERADFVLGSVTPKHTHRGPGIRVLLSGEVEGEIGDETNTYRAGDAWLERGPDPVIGRSSPTLPTSFIRVMVLPRELLGKTSFQYWDEKEARKVRTGRFRIFVDDPVAL